MSKDVKRGYVEQDEKQFGKENWHILSKAAMEVHFLLNHGYDVKQVTTFVGNHYKFSERQRLALARIVSSDSMITMRREKEVGAYQIEEKTVCIDGFNTIITLEVALAGSLTIKGMDGCIRDLAGLRGTYRVIEVTKKAVEMIYEQLLSYKIKKAVFYLDAPVSNSGRLKTLLLEMSESYSFEVEVEVINDVDHVLEQSEYVITSDAIILNRCRSWINLNRDILSKIDDVWCLNIGKYE